MSNVIAVEYINLDGEICTEHEYVTDGITVQDILDGYESIGCEVIRWYNW